LPHGPSPWKSDVIKTNSAMSYELLAAVV